MPSNPANSDPSGEAGRVRCLYCGANNFPASASCWQCGRPLKAVPAGTPATGPAFAPPVSASPAYTSSLASSVADTRLANKAAAALGLLFPYVGIPVGIVFLMLDDPRKTQLGWITIGWSVVGSVLNAIALFATLAPLWAIFKGMPHGGGTPPSLPGLPNMGGDGTGLLWPGWILGWILALYV